MSNMEKYAKLELCIEVYILLYLVVVGAATFYFSYLVNIINHLS